MYDQPIPVRFRISIIGFVFFILCLLFNALQIYVIGFNFRLEDIKPILSGAAILFITSFLKTFLIGISAGANS